MCKKQSANDNAPKNIIEIKQYLLAEPKKQDLCIFEIKQLADKEAAYKAQCLKAIAEYKTWHRSMSDETDAIEVLYGTMEGNVYREKMRNMIQLYWAIRKHFRSAFTSYIAQMKVYTPPSRMAA